MMQTESIQCLQCTKFLLIHIHYLILVFCILDLVQLHFIEQSYYLSALINMCSF